MGWPTYVAIAGTTLALSFTDLMQRRLPNRLVLLFTVAVLGLVLLGDHPPRDQRPMAGPPGRGDRRTGRVRGVPR